MSYTLIIIIVTVLVSLAAFNNDELYNKLILWPRRMDNLTEHYRLLTSGFIHADWPHLFFNMFALFCFGKYLEMEIEAITGSKLLFLFLYLTGIIIASLPSFLKNRHNTYYRSLGASGGVASVLFATIYFTPWNKIYLMFIPVGIPSIIFGVLYLGYSAYMSKKGTDNVNHGAHFWGSVYGFLFALILDPTHGQSLWYQLTNPSF